MTVLAIAVAYPILYAQNWLWGSGVPIFTSLPTVDTMVTMAVYTMMALGLNMVVGYAGLLDLGYVAFFAIGAYCAAWFASPHFARPDFATACRPSTSTSARSACFQASEAFTSPSGSSF